MGHDFGADFDRLDFLEQENKKLKTERDKYRSLTVLVVIVIVSLAFMHLTLVKIEEHLRFLADASVVQVDSIDAGRL